MANQRRFSNGRNERSKKVNGQAATRTEFYKQILWKLVKSLFKVDADDDFPVDYLINNLVTNGFIIVTDTSAGVLALRGSLTGYNYVQMPTQAVIVVPGMSEMRRTIGVDCEIIYLERMWTQQFYTFRKIVDIFAEKLASADAAIDVNLFNSRGAFIAEAETKAQAETIKAAFDAVTEGDPLVVYRKSELTQNGLSVFFGNVKNNFVADVIQDSKRTIMNEFLTYLGINNANTDKRERLITGEVDSNNIELAANVAVWRDNLERSMSRVKGMFPDFNLNITLQFDQSKMEGGTNNDIEGCGDSMGNGTSDQ